MIDPETIEYLDGPWTTNAGPGLNVTIFGSDGDPIVTLHWWNAAHFLTPEAVGEYLMMLHAYRDSMSRSSARMATAIEARHRRRNV